MRLNATQQLLLQRYVNLPLLSPDDFLAKYSLSYEAVAEICCCSRSTAEHWFAHGGSYRSPAASYQKLLAIADFVFENAELLRLLFDDLGNDEES